LKIIQIQRTEALTLAEELCTAKTAHLDFVNIISISYFSLVMGTNWVLDVGIRVSTADCGGYKIHTYVLAIL